MCYDEGISRMVKDFDIQNAFFIIKIKSIINTAVTIVQSENLGMCRLHSFFN